MGTQDARLSHSQVDAASRCVCVCVCYECIQNTRLVIPARPSVRETNKNTT